MEKKGKKITTSCKLGPFLWVCPFLRVLQKHFNIRAKFLSKNHKQVFVALYQNVFIDYLVISKNNFYTMLNNT